MSDYEIQERRQVYWEILTYDRLQSMCFGRPCALSNRNSDTAYPDDPTLISDVDGCKCAFSGQFADFQSTGKSIASCT